MHNATIFKNKIAALLFFLHIKPKVLFTTEKFIHTMGYLNNCFLLKLTYNNIKIYNLRYVRKNQYKIYISEKEKLENG
jgi:hypothetical protein